MSSISSFFARSLVILLVISLLSNSTPALSQTIVAAANEWSTGALFWFHWSGARKLFQSERGNSNQERQSDRDAKVTKLKIFPGDVTLIVGQTLHLSAVAYDRDEATVGGVKITWTGRDEERKRLAPLLSHGEFRAVLTGKFKITAESGGKKDQITITVVSGPQLPKKGS